MGWTPTDLTILVPMLGRPHHVAPLVESVEATTPGAAILFLVSPPDIERRVGLGGPEAVYAAIDAAGGERITIPYRPRGDYARKINMGYRRCGSPLVFTGASDLRFHEGWFEAATARLEPGIGVVGTNDLGNPFVVAGKHATHFLVTREYADLGTIDVPRSIFCELYPHEYVDNELIGTAKHRGAYAMALDSHVEHRHPHWCKDVPTDSLYDQQSRRMTLGRKIYRQRERLWT